jgi:hypothetical protein
MTEANGSYHKPRFAKRHYQDIASAIQEAKRRASGLQSPEMNVCWAIIESELANTFAADNERFDRERYYRACQVGSNVRARP